MRNAAWTLEPNAEAAILLPWLVDDSVDPLDKARALEYLAAFLKDPLRSQLEDDETGVFSIEPVPGTSISMTWVMNIESRQVVLAYIG